MSDNAATANDATEPFAREANGDDAVLAELMDQYLSALENGAPLDLDRLVAEYPHLAAQIRTFAQSVDALHQVTRRVRTKSPEKPEQNHARRLGDFQIGPEIGRGGMGVVYEARQISLDRKVALKILPFAAVWNDRHIARFRNEAQAAAQLHHPNIVPVFAVGEERSVHYYAMQFIPGQSLETAIAELRNQSHCAPSNGTARPVADDTLAAGTTERSTAPAGSLSRQFSGNRSAFMQTAAHLGIQAAEALHHAHEFGVVHRDVKPSNLLLDHKGKLWITDFGLARMRNSPGVTVTGDMVGTLRYMSPEQAAGKFGMVDARTDVYSLGATLYELLTLQPAFPGENRHQVLRAIDSQEPIPPRTLNAEVPIDLETIVLQAMAKERDSRYETAQALADDLRRFVEGKPTLARRPTIADRTAKWLRRHRWVAASAATVLLLVTALSTAGAILLARERGEKEAALVLYQQQLAEAESNFRQARQVVDRFGIQLADQLQGTPGTERLRQQLLLETLSYYEGFLEKAGTEAGIPDQQALNHLKAGVVSAKLGADRRAMEEYRAAQQILERLIEKKPADATLQSQLALSRNNVALLLARQGDPAAALAEYEQAIKAQQYLVAAHPGERTYAGQLAESHVNRGTLLGQLGQKEAAIQSLTHAVTILHEAAAASPEHPQHAHNLAIAYNNLSFVQRQSEPNLAQQSARRAVEILSEVIRRPDAVDECLADLALCYCNLAAIQGQAGRIAEAIASYGMAVSLGESLVRKSPAVVRHRSELAANLNNLALLQLRTGDVAAAAESFRYANRLFATLLADHPDEVSLMSGWAALLNNQALALAEIERYEDALPAYRQAVEVQRSVVERVGASEPVLQSLSRMYYNYGQALQALGRWDEAQEAALQRRAIWQGNGPRLFGVAVELAGIGEQSREAGASLDESAALETLRESLSSGYQPQTPPGDDPRFRAFWKQSEFVSLVNSESGGDRGGIGQDGTTRQAEEAQP